jgi:hypothetical protein
MGACFGKPSNLEIVDKQNEKDHKLIMSSLKAIETNFKEIAKNNNNYLSKFESQFGEISKKNEESTLANREQIDYLIKNCVAFGERIKNLEIDVKDDKILINGILEKKECKKCMETQEI